MSVLDVRDRYEALGGRFVVHEKPHELHPGMWVTGPIPRIHPEKNWTATYDLMVKYLGLPKDKPITDYYTTEYLPKELPSC